MSQTRKRLAKSLGEHMGGSGLWGGAEGRRSWRALKKVALEGLKAGRESLRARKRVGRGKGIACWGRVTQA